MNVIRRIILFLSIALIGLGYSFGQSDKPLSELKLKEIKGMTKNAIRLGDSYTALYYCEEWSKRKPENLEVTYQLAQLYEITRNYKRASEEYEKLTSHHAEEYPLSLYNHALMLIALEQYEEAVLILTQFKKSKTKLKDNYYRKQLKIATQTCEYALLMQDSSEVAVVEHLGNEINKPHIEFSPELISEDILLYGSLDVDGVDYYNINEHDSLTIPLRKIYYAERKDSIWKSKGEFPGPFNTEAGNMGGFTFNTAKDKVYFTICNKNWRNQTICELYVSEKFGDSWTNPVRMNETINLKGSTSTQPAVGKESKKNREVVYFVSNREGGKGGLDIWYTEYNEKKKAFKSPRNAGSKVNSKGDEMTPYYDLETRTLYFSSNGKVGYGGLDVYKTLGEKGKWEEATPLGKNINTSYDDLDFVLNENKDGGYLVSNRPGGNTLLSETCCDDIYEFTYTNFIDIKLIGTVLDSSSCLAGYKVSLFLKDSTGQKDYLTKVLEVDSCGFDLRLNHGYDYVLEVSKNGYLKSSVEVSTKQVTESVEIEKNIELEPLPKEPIVLKGILYEFNSDELTDRAKQTLDTTLLRLLLENKTLVVEIASHTDNLGAEAYNQRLSESRAESVVKYLVSHGIHPDRLKAVGYGESKPIAPNQNEDGSDNPEGRSLNRRTEFSIIGESEIENQEDEEEDFDFKEKLKKEKVKGGF